VVVSGVFLSSHAANASSMAVAAIHALYLEMSVVFTCKTSTTGLHFQRSLI
jgi:hypothetical protein